MLKKTTLLLILCVTTGLTACNTKSPYKDSGLRDRARGDKEAKSGGGETGSGDQKIASRTDRTPDGKRDGGWSSGGGDAMYFVFLKGKQHALTVLENLEKRSLTNPTIKSEVSDWILENRTALIADLEASKLQWTDSASQTTCAFTNFNRNETIHLSTRHCIPANYSHLDAGKLLIHETAHHFGISDESFADDVAIAVYLAWEELKLKSVPSCEENSNLISTLIIGSWAQDLADTREMRGTSAHVAGDEFTFEKDLTVLKDLPGNGFCALTAGWMIVKSSNGKISRDRFYIPDTNENPVLYYYRETAQGLNFEFSLVQVIKAKENKADRLFIGGDHEWKSGFESYRRK